jgi:hypothetical protein
VEEQWKGEPCIAEVLAQNPAVMVQPFAAEEKVVWGLLGSTATVGAVCFAYAEEVCFVVAMATSGKKIRVLWPSPWLG